MTKQIFKEGQKVQIKVDPKNHPATRALEHNGEIVTIKKYSPFLQAYMLEEYPDERVGQYVIPCYFGERCLVAIEK